MTVAAEPLKTALPGRLTQAASLAVPLIVFFFIQNAIGIATLAMIGRLGGAGLAGIGVANAVYGMLLALLYGFDTGVQALVSRATGAGKPTGAILAEAVVAAAALGAALALIVFLLGPQFVALLLPDRAGAAAGGAFLRGAAPSLFFLSLTIPCNALWIGSGRPNISFLVTLALAPFQILVTWPLMFGLGALPPLGAAGAGLALSAATLAGVVLQFALVSSRVPDTFTASPGRSGVLTILRIGWPISLQQSFLQLGLMLSFAIVSRLGVAEVAVLNVLITLTLVPIQAAVGIGTACATLVGQALGRGDTRDAMRWGWQMAAAAALILGPLGLIAVIAPRTLLGVFLSDPAIVDLAVVPAQLAGAGIAVDAFMRVLTFALRGAGATAIASGIPFIGQWLVQLPLMAWIGLALRGDFVAIIAIQVAVVVLEAAAFALVWWRRRWAKARLAA